MTTEIELRQSNCLSHWFPIIAEAGVPVPKTEIFHMSREDRKAIFGVFDGNPIPDSVKPFLDSLADAVRRLGNPAAFLRTGQTSGKHNWKNTCYVESADDIASHVINIIEFSECCDFMGLPWDIWCVREMLPIKPLIITGAYGDMPVNREVRSFVSNGSIVCVHPYWPKQAIMEGININEDLVDQPLRKLLRFVDDVYEELCEWDKDAVSGLVQQVADTISGDWSVDLLETDNGWYVTDMAIASMSFHWEGCVEASRFS